MLHTKFQVSKPSGSEEEDFLIFFYVFLWLEPRTPSQDTRFTCIQIHAQRINSPSKYTPMY